MAQGKSDGGAGLGEEAAAGRGAARGSAQRAT